METKDRPLSSSWIRQRGTSRTMPSPHTLNPGGICCSFQALKRDPLSPQSWPESSPINPIKSLGKIDAEKPNGEITCCILSKTMFAAPKCSSMRRPVLNPKDLQCVRESCGQKPCTSFARWLLAGRCRKSVVAMAFVFLANIVKNVFRQLEGTSPWNKEVLNNCRTSVSRSLGASFNNSMTKPASSADLPPFQR